MPQHSLACNFLALAKRYPDKIAIEAGSRQFTFSTLMKAAGVVASRLREQGIEKGSRFGVAMTNNEHTFIVMQAAWLLGASILVTDFRAKAAERQKLAATLDIALFVEDRKAPGQESYPAYTLDVKACCDNLSHIDLPPAPGSDASSIAVIGISSGTSGMPQPVALTHECLFTRYALAHMSPQWQTDSTFAVSAPLAFSATRKHVLSRLLDGGKVIFIPLLAGPDEFSEIVNTKGVDAVLAVPTILRGLFPLAPEQGYLFPRVSWLMSCGAPMLPDEKKLARDTISPGFIQNYGSTMAGMITLLETADIEQHSSSVGRAIPHVLIEIVDEHNSPQPPGIPGTVRVRTPAMAAELDGYRRPSERMNDDLILDGWIYPGDIGILDEDGFLTIVGRTSDLIIRGGVNVFPAEIEEYISAHPAVNEAAVVGWEDPLVGEEIAAFVVTAEAIAPQAILAWCRSKIQPDKQPREIFMVESLPRNANGKIIKNELKKQLPVRK